MREISDMISRGEIKDPRIKEAVITNFYLSDDMGFLRLYFTRLSDKEDIENITKGLNSAAGFIRKKVGDSLRLKKLPKIEFQYDEVLEQGYKIDELIREVKGD